MAEYGFYHRRQWEYEMYARQTALLEQVRCPLEVRWDLIPENTGSSEDANQSFWTQDYHNLELVGKRVAQRYDANRKPHQYQVGDTVVYRLNLTSSKVQNMSLPS